MGQGTIEARRRAHRRGRAAPRGRRSRGKEWAVSQRRDTLPPAPAPPVRPPAPHSPAGGGVSFRELRAWGRRLQDPSFAPCRPPAAAVRTIGLPRQHTDTHYSACTHLSVGSGGEEHVCVAGRLHNLADHLTHLRVPYPELLRAPRLRCSSNCPRHCHAACTVRRRGQRPAGRLRRLTWLRSRAPRHAAAACTRQAVSPPGSHHQSGCRAGRAR